MTQRVKEYVYRSTLKTMYGLTDKLIGQIGAPDKLVPNPHYRSGPCSMLYSIERVERWIEEHQDEIDDARTKRAKRSITAQQASDRRRDETIAWAKNVPIITDGIPKNIRRIAEEYYRDCDYDIREVNNNGVLAYIRHNLTNYEMLLSQLWGRIGCAEGYIIIKKRVCDEILSRCPHLKNER
jgi:hypothetical protein